MATYHRVLHLDAQNQVWVGNLKLSDQAEATRNLNPPVSPARYF